MMIYDIIIIGAGPSGLALAHYCSSKNKKILIIDKESSIGGCHRVRRINYNNEKLFTEHGPRVYLSSFINFKELLKDFGTNFNELFKNDNSANTFNIIKENLLPIINLKELYILTITFIYYLFNNNYGNDISMHDYMINNSFSEKIYNFINKLCIATDGGNVYKYSLNKFLKGSDQNLFYSAYQPKLPNDEGLFKIWRDNLKNVDFALNTKIININNDYVITNNNLIYYGSKIVLAIPPLNLISILNSIPNNTVKNCFGDINNLNKWANDTKYLNYISVIFHWNYKIKLNKTTTFTTNTEWSIIYIILSDNMTFNNKTSKTVISCAISERNIKSKRINKTANECTKNELIDEIYYQLLIKFPKLPYPSISLLSPGNYFYNNEWIDTDTAFINTPNKNNYIPFQSKTIPSIYNLGTHNGCSLYDYTSIESSICNAKILATKIYPDLKEKIKIKKIFWSITNVIYIIIIFLIIFIIIKYLI